MITWLNPDHFGEEAAGRVARGLRPYPQQLDIDGGLHDLAPEHEAMRLFDSAPQIKGQMAMATDANEALAAVKSVPCPTCHAPAGRSCKRPSGHRAASPHAARIAAANV